MQHRGISLADELHEVLMKSRILHKELKNSNLPSIQAGREVTVLPSGAHTNTAFKIFVFSRP